MLASIVVPCFNEEHAINHFLSEISTSLNTIDDAEFEILFVDDGSTDETAACIKKICRIHPEVRLVCLSRNFGKEAALTAGLDHATGDVIIPMDCDMQDPPELIPQLIAKWREGYKVVLAVRRTRDEDGWLKRKTASLFFALLRRISHIDIPENVGDFRLMDREVVQAIRKFQERARFMKGVMAAAGFSTTTIEYDRPSRHSGKTSFSFWKLWNFALDGITGFSTLPLRIWTYIGVLVAGIALSYASWTIFKTWYWGVVTPGYATQLTVTLLLGAAVLIGLGIQGEYIARIVSETKQRPLYIVESKVGFESFWGTAPLSPPPPLKPPISSKHLDKAEATHLAALYERAFEQR